MRGQVENKNLFELNLTMDFTGSEDIMIENTEEGSGQQVIETQVKAECAETVAVAKEFPHSRLLWQVNWSKVEASRERQQQYANRVHANLNSLIDKSKKIFKLFPLAESSLEAIEQVLFENTYKNFIDPEFPPCDQSLGLQSKDYVVHWRRPTDFMHLNTHQSDHSEIKIFHKDIEPSDIKCGPYSKKWLLCAMATLAERPALVEKLFVTREYKKNGAYRLKVNKSGVWQEVTVDDYMPCQLDGAPLFTRTHGNELWVQLLEKTYAKVHGSYENLKEGHPNEALQDFTGFPTVLYDFTDPEMENFLKTGDFFKLLVHFQQEDYLMSASAPGSISDNDEVPLKERTKQLQPGHTYSIVQVREVYNHKLINVRNLWGFFEWEGAWSRKSAFWTPDIKELLKPSLEMDDGTFWMCYEDFIRHFGAVNVTKVRQMNEIRLKGQFVRINEQEVSSKYFYYLQVPKKTTLLLGLHQVDEKIQRVLPSRRYLDTSFLILQKTPEGTSLYQIQDLVSARDCEFECVLEAGGQYVILPRSNGIAMGKMEGEAVKLGEKGALGEAMEGAIEEIYYRYDTQISNSLDYEEFREIQLAMGVKVVLNKEEFDATIIKGFCSTDRGLTLKGFKEYFKDQVKALGEEQVFLWFANLGFDSSLHCHTSRSFILSLHSDSPLSLEQGDTLPTNLDQAAQQMILREKASIAENHAECCLLYYPKQ